MGSNVNFKGGRLSERFTAILARIRSLSGMNPFVAIPLSRLGETPFAVTARIRFYSGVHSLVHNHFVFLGKTHSAHVAQMYLFLGRFGSGVDLGDVTFQRSHRYESVTTKRALGGMRLAEDFDSVRFELVRYHRLGVSEQGCAHHAFERFHPQMHVHVFAAQRSTMKPFAALFAIVHVTFLVFGVDVFGE